MLFQVPIPAGAVLATAFVLIVLFTNSYPAMAFYLRSALFLGSLKPRLVKIPPRIMHGWKALTAPEVLVVNCQTHVYDAADEFKFPWDCVLTEVWEPKNG